MFSLPTLAFALAACGGSAGSGTPPPSPSPPPGAMPVNVVSDPNNVGAYNPASLTVKVGDEVAWLFQDTNNAHTVTSDDNSSFNSDPDGNGHNAGYVFTHTFDKTGTFKYTCTLHPGMTGTIIVK